MNADFAADQTIPCLGTYCFHMYKNSKFIFDSNNGSQLKFYKYFNLTANVSAESIIISTNRMQAEQIYQSSE